MGAGWISGTVANAAYIPGDRKTAPAGYLLFSSPVFKGKDRVCDVCGAAIVKGEQYAIVTVSKDNAELFHALTETEPGMAPTISVDSHGNVRLDLCLNCRLNTKFPGDETVQ